MRQFALSGRRRRVAVVVAVVALLSMLVVVADRLVARSAADRLADRLACVVASGAEPVVSLGGFPVTAGVLTGRLARLRVTVPELQHDGLRVHQIRADLRDVAGTGAGPVTVRSLALSAVVGYDSLPISRGGRDLRYRQQDGRLAVDTAVDLLGQRVPVTVLADPVITDGRLTVTPVEVELFGVRRPAAALLARIGGGPEMSRDLPELPAGLTYRAVEVTESGLRIHIDGQDLTLPRDARPTGGPTCEGA
ncbi:LmeA family phospholipid-binding protein [Micromonospora palythoicola]|uniref:LmeA family phospholipid-binding protein n=1 Tax=Micromonospora palythoicola TaxID=3120507 RepID=UPI002FCDE612